MGDIFSMLVDSNLVSQVSDEGIHLAFVAVVSGIGAVFSVLFWLLRRDIKRRDIDRVAMASEIVELGKEISQLKDKHGSEISDTRIAIERLFDRAGLPSPNYPSR